MTAAQRSGISRTRARGNIPVMKSCVAIQVAELEIQLPAMACRIDKLDQVVKETKRYKVTKSLELGFSIEKSQGEVGLFA